MWVKRDVYEGLVGRERALAAKYERLLAAFQRERASREAGDVRFRELTERVVQLASRPVQVVQPPDTSGIIKETVEGVCSILNGWRANEASQMQVLEPATYAEPSGEDFLPPWDKMPAGGNGGYVDARIGNYTPYVPGQGNSVPPKGGVE